MIELWRQQALVVGGSLAGLEVPWMRHVAWLIGDAAFVARPHVGAGVTKAFEDGVALARCLQGSDDIDASLAMFDALRTPIG